jgi:hypothetical protein
MAELTEDMPSSRWRCLLHLADGLGDRRLLGTEPPLLRAGSAVGLRHLMRQGIQRNLNPVWS